MICLTQKLDIDTILLAGAIGNSEQIEDASNQAYFLDTKEC